MFFLSRAISSFYEPSYVVVNTRIIPSNKLIKLGGGGGGHSFFFPEKEGAGRGVGQPVQGLVLPCLFRARRKDPSHARGALIPNPAFHISKSRRALLRRKSNPLAPTLSPFQTRNFFYPVSCTVSV